MKAIMKQYNVLYTLIEDGMLLTYENYEAKPFICKGSAKVVDGGQNIYYIFNNVLHNDIGPAVIIKNHGYIYSTLLEDTLYYLNGVNYSFEDFLMYQRDTKHWPAILTNLLNGVNYAT